MDQYNTHNVFKYKTTERMNTDRHQIPSKIFNVPERRMCTCTVSYWILVTCMVANANSQTALQRVHHGENSCVNQILYRHLLLICLVHQKE